MKTEAIKYFELEANIAQHFIYIYLIFHLHFVFECKSSVEIF